MPTFRYHGRTEQGQAVRGELEAETAEAARDQLSAQGVRATSLVPIERGPLPDPAAASPAAISTAGNGLSASAASGAQLVELLQAVAHAGTSRPQDVAAGLEAAAAELRWGRVARGLRRVAAGLRGGAGLSDALTTPANLLPACVPSLLAAGLRSDELPIVLDELAQAAQRAVDVRRQVVLAVAYPLFMVVIAVLLFVGFLSVALGQVVDLYSEVNIAQGVAPQAVDWWVREGIPVIGRSLPALVAGLIVVAVLLRQRWFKRIPLVGPAFRFAALAQWTGWLAILVERRLPLAVALRQAGGACHDPELQAAADRAAHACEAGRTLAEAFESQLELPPSLAPLVAWGETHQALPAALKAATEMFEGRLTAQLFLLRTAFPPLFVLLLLGMFSLLAAAAEPVFRMLEMFF